MDRVDGAFLARLRELHGGMDEALRESPPDRRAYRELNAAFHRVIWAQSGNNLLAEIINSIARKPLVSPTFNNWTEEELQRSNRQHGDLTEAFALGDGEWAQSIMHVHLLSSRANYRRIASIAAALPRDERGSGSPDRQDPAQTLPE